MPDEKKNDAQFDPAGLMESAFLMGIGVLELTKEKTQGLTNDLIERGKMSQSDAKKVSDTISEIAEKQQKVMRETVAEETDKVLKTSGVATKDEVAELKEQIAELKAMLEAKGASAE